MVLERVDNRAKAKLWLQKTHQTAKFYHRNKEGDPIIL